MTKNQIEFILSSDWKIVRNCGVITKVNIGRDQARKGPRQINKHRNKLMITSMRKASREITSDRDFFFFLYVQIFTSHSMPKQCPPHWKVQRNQVLTAKKYLSLQTKERAIKRMKRHKAQGMDGITSDIIKLEGGEGELFSPA